MTPPLPPTQASPSPSPSPPSPALPPPAAAAGGGLPPSGPAWRPLALAACLAACAGLAAVALDGVGPAARRRRGEPPALALVPPFRLVDQRGAPFGLDDLRGRPWVACFLFTRCTTVCPALAERMREVQARTEDVARLTLVSFSVDPEFDTPARLADFAAQHGAGPRWRFLTGPLDAVRGAVEEGLRVGMDQGGPRREVEDVLHGTCFVLVDAAGRIRGYHDVSDEPGLAALLADLRAVAGP